MLNFAKWKVLSEGGAFGHLSNVFDLDYSKRQLVDIINNALDLNFTRAEIKTDAINLMVSVKNGQVVAARNKSHLKNYGENAMDINAVADKFAGRGVGVAYTMAMEDLQAAIGRLSTKQIAKVFDEGKKWLSIEVIGQGGENIIDYGGISELRLHGTIEHNEAGEKTSQIDKEAARMLSGMIKQREADRQKNFAIKNLTQAQFKQIKDADKHKKDLIRDLNKVMGSAKTISEYKEREFGKYIKSSDPQLRKILINRWVNQNKSYRITQLYKEYPDDKSWIQKTEKQVGQIYKKIMLPLEYIFLKLGGLVVGALKVFMTVNPENTVRDLKRKLKDAIDTINTKGDDKAKAKLQLELKRLQAAGGVDNIAPEEGITFFVGDDFLKLTGTFAPLNQILGMLYSL